MGDDAAALAANQRLRPLLPGIENHLLLAVSQLGMAWCAPLTGDFGGALQAAAKSLEQLRGLDEPLWTALAVGSLGTLERILARYDDALRHLREAHDLGDRFGSTRLPAWSRVQLGTVSILQGDFAPARTVLDEALELSVAARSTRMVTLCLATYAQLAFAEGDRERAALLAGAAEGLRRRRHAGLADAASGRGRPDRPGSPDAGCGAIRSGLLRRLQAHPARRDSHRPGPAQHQHPDILSRYPQERETAAWTSTLAWRFRLASCWPIPIGSFGVSAETWQSTRISAQIGGSARAYLADSHLPGHRLARSRR